MTAGAKLGSPAAVVVTIETSDDPMGLFGFVNASDLSLENPSRSTDVSFVIEREGGAEGDIEVVLLDLSYWLFKSISLDLTASI